MKRTCIAITEPEAGMRKILQDTVKDPRVSILNDTFEKTTVPDAWADAVVIATVRRLGQMTMLVLPMRMFRDLFVL